MKTAEEILKENDCGFGSHLNYYDVIKSMKIYAKQVAENALHDASLNADYGVCQNDDGQEPFHHESNIFVDKQSILNTEIILP